MAGHLCRHCKEWIPHGQPHDCWTTTEAALTEELSDDLRDAYQRLRETAVEFGEQRIYASGTAIMFSRKACYFFVRPRRRSLQLCVFLARAIRAPLVRRVEPSSKTKFAHLIDITHRDQVEAPITDWLLEAYQLQDRPPAAAPPRKPARAAVRKRRAQRATPASSARSRKRSRR